MEGRRNKKWDNSRRSQNRRPPRGNNWHPTFPSWEKDFCRVVGCMDWETFLQMKKFIHLYNDVIKWDDSAGEEAFHNAKKRFWAEINGRPCDVPLPEPDLYLDEIDWASELDPELLADLENKVVVTEEAENHEPVIIFGDSLLPKEAYSPVGWGDVEEDLKKIPATGWGDDGKDLKVPATGWGDDEKDVKVQATGWGDEEENLKVPAISSTVNPVDPWEQNWVDPYNNGVSNGWPGYSNDTWQFEGGSGNVPGYMTWGGGWNDGWGWNYGNNQFNYEVGPGVRGQGAWNGNSFAARVGGGGYGPGYGPSSGPWNDYGWNKMAYWGQQSAAAAERGNGSREWNSFAPLGHHSAIAVGQTWNQ